MPITIQGTGLVGAGGGGGGGGSATSPADIAAGINQSTDIDSIITNTSDTSDVLAGISNELGSASSTSADSTLNGSLMSRLRWVSDRLEQLNTRIGDVTSPSQTNAASDSPLIGYVRGLVSLISSRLPVSGDYAPNGLTNTQLRATPVSVVGQATVSYTTLANTSATITTTVPANARLQSFLIQNLIASTIHVQVHATTPAGGAVPTASYRVTANSTLLLGNDFYGDGGSIVPTANPVIAISSTHGTFTAQASPNTSLTVRYIP